MPPLYNRGTSVTIQLNWSKGYMLTHKYAFEKISLLKNHIQQNCGKSNNLNYIKFARRVVLIITHVRKRAG